MRKYLAGQLQAHGQLLHHLPYPLSRLLHTKCYQLKIRVPRILLWKFLFNRNCKMKYSSFVKCSLQDSKGKKVNKNQIIQIKTNPNEGGFSNCLQPTIQPRVYNYRVYYSFWSELLLTDSWKMMSLDCYYSAKWIGQDWFILEKSNKILIRSSWLYQLNWTQWISGESKFGANLVSIATWLSWNSPLLFTLLWLSMYLFEVH